jgi:hypothetical protein
MKYRKMKKTSKTKYPQMYLLKSKRPRAFGF